jgi:hypothetical protein
MAEQIQQIPEAVDPPQVVAAQGFDNPMNFSETNPIENRQFMAAAICGIMYATNVLLVNELAQLFGGTLQNYTPAGGPDHAPASATIATNDTVIVAIQGTTMWQQWVDYIAEYENTSTCFLGSGYQLLEAGDIGESTLPDQWCDDPRYVGTVYGTFKKMAPVIFQRIGIAINDNPGKKLILVGHSLGGAMVDLCALFLSMASQYRKFFGGFMPGYENLHDNVEFGQSFTFGCPKTMDFRGFIDRPATNRVQVLADQGWNPTTIHPDNTFGRKVMHIIHPYDPVPLVPVAPNELYPNWVKSFTKTNIEFTRQGSRGPVLTPPAGWYDEIRSLWNPFRQPLPELLSTFRKIRVTMHLMSRYFQIMERWATEKFGPLRGPYAALYDLAKRASLVSNENVQEVPPLPLN